MFNNTINAIHVQRNRTAVDKRVIAIVAFQVAIVSLAAFLSELLIFDEVHWYRIDYNDALVWALVVTQVFAMAVYVERFRIHSFRSSFQAFYCLAALSAGLTFAATLFLILDDSAAWNPLVMTLVMMPGYGFAVFVLLVAMFLQLRLAMVCFKTVSQLFVRQPKTRLATAEFTASSFAMADVFAFTGLAAVSISTYSLTLKVLTEADTFGFLAMFYSASVAGFCTQAVIQRKWNPAFRLLSCIAIVLAMTAIELHYLQYLGLPRSLKTPMTMLVWNAEVCSVMAMQCWMLSKLIATQKSLQVSAQLNPSSFPVESPKLSARTPN